MFIFIPGIQFNLIKWDIIEEYHVCLEDVYKRNLDLNVMPFSVEITESLDEF